MDTSLRLSNDESATPSLRESRSDSWQSKKNKEWIASCCRTRNDEKGRDSANLYNYSLIHFWDIDSYIILDSCDLDTSGYCPQYDEKVKICLAMTEFFAFRFKRFSAEVFLGDFVGFRARGYEIRLGVY